MSLSVGCKIWCLGVLYEIEMLVGIERGLVCCNCDGLGKRVMSEGVIVSGPDGYGWDQSDEMSRMSVCCKIRNVETLHGHGLVSGVER